MKKELLFCGNSRHKFNKFLIPSDAALMRWIKYLPCCFLQNNSKLFFLSIRFTTPSTENFHSLFPSIAAVHRFPLVFFLPVLFFHIPGLPSLFHSSTKPKSSFPIKQVTVAPTHVPFHTPKRTLAHNNKKHTCVVVCCSIRLIKSRLGGANSNLYYRGTLLLRIRLPSPARTFPQMRDGPRWNPAGIDSGHPNVTPFWPAVPFDHRPSLAFACSPRCVITSLYSFFFARFGAANSS